MEIPTLPTNKRRLKHVLTTLALFTALAAIPAYVQTSSGVTNSQPPIPPSWSILEDSDQDGMKDADELLMGMDPLDPADGLSDLDGDGIDLAWEFAIGSNPDVADTDMDGWSDSEEYLLYGTDPLDPLSFPLSGAPDNSGASALEITPVPEATPTPPPPPPSLSNGDFSDVGITTWKSMLNSKEYQGGGFTWNAGAITSWTAYVGTTMEVWDAGGEKFVELDGSPGNYGIKQQIANAKAGGYVLAWRQSGRNSTRADSDPYRVKVYYLNGTTEVPIAQSDEFSGFDKLHWTDNALGFQITPEQLKSANGIIYVAFIPTGSSLNTYGTLIDKVNLLPVEVVDISNNQEISDVAWIKGHKTDGSGEEPEMPKLEARIPGLPNTFQVLWKLESRYPRRNGRDDLDVPYAGGYDAGVFTTGGRPWKIWEDIDFSTEPIFGGNETLKFKLIGANGPLGNGAIEFKIRGENPDDTRCKAHIIANQGTIWYAWAIAKHESRDSKGDYNQFANGLDNGGAGAHGAKGEPFYAPSEGDGWGLFQRDSASGIPVTTKETWSWNGNMRGFINDEYPEQLLIADNYVNSVMRNNPTTFVEPQFTIKGQVISGRDVLALTWYNGPQGRSNSRLMHFNGSSWLLDLPNAPEKSQPYVHEIMDTYNGN